MQHIPFHGFIEKPDFAFPAADILDQCNQDIEPFHPLRRDTEIIEFGRLKRHAVCILLNESFVMDLFQVCGGEGGVV